MNIFILDKNPELSAEYHVDKHIVKMIIELGQLLSTAHRQLDGHDVLFIDSNGKKHNKRLLDDEYIEQIQYLSKGEIKTKLIVPNKLCYLQTHPNHPSAKWVRESSDNYYWTFNLFLALLNEYTYRFGKEHKSTDQISFLEQLPKNIFLGRITTPKLAMDEKYKILTREEAETDFDYAVLNYQHYYREGKSHLHQWTKRQKPYFI